MRRLFIDINLCHYVLYVTCSEKIEHSDHFSENELWVLV